MEKNSLLLGVVAVVVILAVVYFAGVPSFGDDAVEAAEIVEEKELTGFEADLAELDEIFSSNNIPLDYLYEEEDFQKISLQDIKNAKTTLLAFKEKHSEDKMLKDLYFVYLGFASNLGFKKKFFVDFDQLYADSENICSNLDLTDFILVDLDDLVENASNTNVLINSFIANYSEEAETAFLEVRKFDVATLEKEKTDFALEVEKMKTDCAALESIEDAKEEVL